MDGTNEIAYSKCSKATFNPFWKNPEHVTNRIARSTRSQIKKKTPASNIYVKSYFNYLKFVKNKGTQLLDSDYSDSDSDYISDSDSDSETNNQHNKKTELTGENLIIDIKQEPETAEENIPNVKPELETKQQNADNK